MKIKKIICWIEPNLYEERDFSKFEIEKNISGKKVKLYEIDKLEVKGNYIIYLLDKIIGNTYN